MMRLGRLLPEAKGCIHFRAMADIKTIDEENRIRTGKSEKK
jgi:hypothetical protein